MPERASPPRDLSDLINDSLAPAPTGEVGAVKRALRKLTLRLGRAHARHQQEIDRELLLAIERSRAELQPQVDELQGGLQAAWSAMADSDVRLKRIETRMTQQLEQVSQHARDLSTWMTEIAERVSNVEDRLARVETLVAPDAPFPWAPSFRMETFDAGPAGTVNGFRPPAEQMPGPDGVYLGFEDCFRGPEEAIRERQRLYVPLLTEHAPVLDVGCGRGEFLELMAEAGIEAYGIDLDPAMVSHCHSKGLAKVERADAVGHVESLRDASIGTVFASHVIEHLPYEQLFRFLSSSLEKLAPGGLLVMETVNPHAPQALKHFWIDPTHQHPLFPEVMIALCRLTGYASAYIWFPGGSGNADRDRLQLRDYSIVAQSPEGR